MSMEDPAPAADPFRYQVKTLSAGSVPPEPSAIAEQRRGKLRG
jgi:hypothetical protein